MRVVARTEDSFARRVRAVTTNTSFTAQRLQSIGVPRERILLVPNGVERDRVRSVPAGLPRRLRERHGFSNTPLLAYVGSLSLANHCVDLMLRAFAAAHQERPDLRLALVGGGEDMEKMRRLAADLVGTGVTAVAVSPGSTDTQMLQATADIYGLQTADSFIASSPLRRILKPEELAETISFCCSRTGAVLNGSVVSASGGFVG